jgi:hypothetical protein
MTSHSSERILGGEVKSDDDGREFAYSNAFSQVA